MLYHLTIRPMQFEDLSFAAQCTANEGWVSESDANFVSFFRNDPTGCLIAELEHQPAGICVGTPYGVSGFVGELIVRPELRGRGIGVVLLDHAVRYLRDCGAQTMYLDGVLKAVPLYERYGFRKVCRSWRFSGHLPGKSHPDVRPMDSADLPAVFAIDRRAFGADRSFFLARRLELFPELGKVLVQAGQITGFILGRRGEGWVSFGPWVVTEEATEPLKLLESLTCETGEAQVSIGVLATNQEALDLIRSLGFSERPDSPWRMALGPSDDLGRSYQCLAVGSAAKG